MAWFCMNCGNRMYGTTCGGRWRSEGKYVRCNKKYPSAMAERIPPLDGMIFINEGNSNITRLDQREYDDLAHKRNKYPKTCTSPYPNAWLEAMEVIGERLEKELSKYTGSLPEC